MKNEERGKLKSVSQGSGREREARSDKLALLQQAVARRGWTGPERAGVCECDA
jgi:hypothetical protein